MHILREIMSGAGVLLITGEIQFGQFRVHVFVKENAHIIFLRLHSVLKYYVIK